MDEARTKIASLSTLPVLLVALVVYVAVVSIWRVYLSPLAKIPGPKLAALTGWYETYLDLVKDQGGRFIFEYQRWHEKYGPIVRISPNEVHISDPEYYDELYTKPYDKPTKLEYRFSNAAATFQTPGHKTHKMRRTALNPYFSPRKIADYAPAIQKRIDRLCERFESEYASQNRPICFNDAWGCLTTDTIVEYCFDQDYHFIEKTDFKSEFARAIADLMDGVHVVTQFPFLPKFFQTLPDSAVVAMQPGMKTVLEFNNAMLHQARTVISNKATKGEKTSDVETVFSALLDSDLPPGELQAVRLQHEAISLVGAGIDTTKRALSVATFHILFNHPVRTRLMRELLDTIPDHSQIPKLAELQKLPYLSAVIEETLRLSYGTSQRNTRVPPTAPAKYGKYTLPAGTEISMSTYSIAHNEYLFPNSFIFDPERWLHNPIASTSGKPLSRYMVSFGRGNRMCLGMHLAYAELVLGLASVLRRFGERMELFETGREDVELAHDMFMPQPRKGSQGVRVMIK